MKDSPDIVSAKLASRELDNAVGKRAKITSDRLIVELKDGRTISTPLIWYPRLLHATPAERRNVEVSGYGVHWPDLDEDLSIRGMLLGRKSGESAASMKKWLAGRKNNVRNRKAG